MTEDEYEDSLSMFAAGFALICEKVQAFRVKKNQIYKCKQKHSTYYSLVYSFQISFSILSPNL